MKKMQFEGVVARLNQGLRQNQSPRSLLADAIFSLEGQHYARLLRAVSEIPDVAAHIPGLGKLGTYGQLARWKELGPKLPEAKMFSWTAALLRMRTAELLRFIELENQIDDSLHRKLWASALDILDRVDEELGISIWSLNIRIGLKTNIDGPDSQKQFCKQLQERKDVVPPLKLLIGLLSAQAEPAISADSYYAEIFRYLRDGLSSRPTHQYLAFRAAFFGPFQFRDLGGIMHHESANSVVDQYLTFIRVGQLIHADSRTAKLASPYRTALRLLGNELDDSRIAWLRAAFLDSTEALTRRFAPEVVAVYDAYTCGRYSEAIAKIDDLVVGSYAHSQELLTLRASAVARFGDAVQQVDGTGAIFGEVLAGGDVGNAATAAIRKQISCFNTSRSAAIMHAFVERQTSSFSKEWPVRCERLADLNSSASNPRALFFLGQESVETRRRFLPFLAASPTFALFRAAFQSAKNVDKILESVPASRLAKYRAIAAFRRNGDERALLQFAELEKYGDKLDRMDAAEGQTAALIRLGRVVEASTSMCRYVIENPFSNRRFSIETVCDAIEVAQKGLPRQGMPIEVPNAFGLYSVFRKKDRTYRMGTLCEDFLTSHAIFRPSKLRSIADRIDRTQLRFFLSEVCLISALDSHPVYESHREIEDERVSILQWLLELDPASSAKYAEEIAEITRTQKIGAAMRSVEKSKISVNVIGVKSVLPAEIGESFNRFRGLPRFSTTYLEGLVRQVAELGTGSAGEQSDVLLLFDTPERTAELGKLYDFVRQKFLLSNDFGLDASLSVGVRHIVLPSHLRACFERNDLITSRGSNQEYAANLRWAKLGRTRGGWEDLTLQQSLASFSAAVDTAIQELRDQIIQIKSDRRPRGLLDFSPNKGQVAELESAVSECSSVDSAIDSILMLLWKQTDAGLGAIREYLRVEFVRKLNSALDTLEHASRESHPRLAELEAAITTARTQIHDELDTVSDWFTRGDAAPSEDFDFDLAVDTALAMVNRGHVKRQLRLVRQLQPIRLRGYSLNALVNILVLLFDNALKHSGEQSDDVSLALRTNCSRPFFSIEASNALNSCINIVDLRTKLGGVRAILAEQAATSEKVRDEGGSGYPKILRILRIDLMAKPSIHLDIDPGGNFTVSISFSRVELWA
jgi:hypothetical protein